MESLMTENIGLGFHVPKETVEENGDIITCNEYCEMIDGDCTECPIQKAFDKLAAYEKLQEQGLLLKLPCKVGDVVYFVDRRYDREKRTFVSFVHNGYAKAIKFSSRPTKVTIEYEDIDDNCGRCKGKDVHASNIGKTVFLTKEEAEAKLKELENE